MYSPKVASIKEIIEKLQKYENEHGSGGIVNSIGAVCNGDRTTEYIFHLQDQNGNETNIEINSVRQCELSRELGEMARKGFEKGLKLNYVEPTEELLRLSVKLVIDYCKNKKTCADCMYQDTDGVCLLENPYQWEIEE